MTRRVVSRHVRGWVAMAAWFVTAGCMPLFVPPVPERLPDIEPRLRLAQVEMAWLDGVPGVEFEVVEVPSEGWLAFQWFPPAGGEMASSSVWLSSDIVGDTVRGGLPERTGERERGRWRVVVSWQGEFVRQLEWIEPAGF